MFMHNFEQLPTGIFLPGSAPRIERISHTYNNPSWRYALHLHPDSVELMYIAGGKASITLNQRIFDVGAGDILFIGKGLTHAVASSPKDPSDIWCCLMGGVEFADAATEHPFISVAKSGKFQSFIDAAVQGIYDFSYKEGAAAREICNNLSACLLVLFRQLLTKTDLTFELKSSALAQKVLVYINENYEKKIDLEHLSQVFYSSTSQISREFKKEYDISPINYLIEKRLSEAKWLLINTNETVSSIAERVGYANYYYFAKLFCERIGFMPSEYREKYGYQEMPSGGIEA